MTIVATLVLLGVLIFVHELGHFLAARSVGIRVERFSIGFGPRIWGFQRGDTEYLLAAIPLGGYVKMAGMDDEVMEKIEGGAVEGDAAPSAPRDPSDHFDSKPVWARAWVISAGVILNFAFAFLTYAVVAGVWGGVAPDTLRAGFVRADLLPAGTEALAELPAGVTLRSIGDRDLRHWGELRTALAELPAGETTLRFAQPEGAVTFALPSANEDRARLILALPYWEDPVIRVAEPGSPADRGGLKPGDRIQAVDGSPIQTWEEFRRSIEVRPGVETRLTLERDGGEIVRVVVPNAIEARDARTGELRTVGQVGVLARGPDIAYEPMPAGQALGHGWAQTLGVSGSILGFLRDLFTGKMSPRNLGSIVTIGEASGQAAAEGIPVYLMFMAFFSVNLAILNLLPIPILDGGHLVFLGIEAIRGQPVSSEHRMRWSQVGFAVLIGIMALALGNDFLRLFGL
jgi:regulator of sigma E protease